MIGGKKNNSSGEIRSILGEGLRINGNVVAEGKVRIDGEIVGDVKGDYIILGESGKIKGNVLTNEIVVMGSIEGNIQSEEVEIKSSGKIQGDIITKKLFVELGASIEGHVKTGDFSTKEVQIENKE